METIIRGIYKLAMDSNGLDRTIVEIDSLDIFQKLACKQRYQGTCSGGFTKESKNFINFHLFVGFHVTLSRVSTNFNFITNYQHAAESSLQRRRMTNEIKGTFPHSLKSVPFSAISSSIFLFISWKLLLAMGL